jgi:hypothetical protein
MNHDAAALAATFTQDAVPVEFSNLAGMEESNE